MKSLIEFLTPSEASKYLRVNKRTIYRWAYTGEIPASRAGKQWRFRKAELDQWLKKKAKSSKRLCYK